MNIEITDAFLESIKGVKLNDKNILEMFDYDTYKISEMRYVKGKYISSIILEDLLSNGCRLFKDEYRTTINMMFVSLRKLTDRWLSQDVSETTDIRAEFEYGDDIIRLFKEEKIQYVEDREAFCERVRKIITEARIDYKARKDEYQEYLRLKEKFEVTKGE